MDIGTIITILTGVAGTLGGYVGGKQVGKTSAVGLAVDTVELLQVQVEILSNDRQEKDALVADLRARVEILEGLVTQRAEVDAVHGELLGVRGIVDRIATKISA